uniref:Uncharacterized protein n=1 Tax=Romanomermis culicivorax TaxID=13658 RepID=A0A915J4Q2_ROMCU
MVRWFISATSCCHVGPNLKLFVGFTGMRSKIFRPLGWGRANSGCGHHLLPMRKSRMACPAFVHFFGSVNCGRPLLAVTVVGGMAGVWAVLTDDLMMLKGELFNMKQEE